MFEDVKVHGHCDLVDGRDTWSMPARLRALLPPCLNGWDPRLRRMRGLSGSERSHKASTERKGLT